MLYKNTVKELFSMTPGLCIPLNTDRHGSYCAKNILAAMEPASVFSKVLIALQHWKEGKRVAQELLGAYLGVGVIHWWQQEHEDGRGHELIAPVQAMIGLL